MKTLLIVLLAATSANAVAGNCTYPDDIAADGSICGGRAASVRPDGEVPPPEYYAAPVQQQVTLQQAEARKQYAQDEAMNDKSKWLVNTGKQRWICPVTAMEGDYKYRAVEGDLNDKANYIIVDGHKRFKQIQENDSVIYVNSNLSEYSFMFDESHVGGTALWNSGNNGNAEVDSPCFKFTGSIPGKYQPMNPIDAEVVIKWMEHR